MKAEVKDVTKPGEEVKFEEKDVVEKDKVNEGDKKVE